MNFSDHMGECLTGIIMAIPDELAPYGWVVYILLLLLLSKYFVIVICHKFNGTNESYWQVYCKWGLHGAFGQVNQQSILINTFPTSALHPSSISDIFALFLTQKLPRPSPVLLSVQDWIMSIPFLPAFLLAISIVFSAFKFQKFLARVITRSTINTTSALNSLHWLPIQQRINFKLATLVRLNTCHLYHIPIWNFIHQKW